MAKITSIEGVGEAFAQKLKDSGIVTTQALLDAGSSEKGRDVLSEKSGVTAKLILQWVNHVDLCRIKGVGEEYADLLEAAGVDTVPELGQRNAENLYKKLVSANEEKKLVRKLPTQTQAKNWVEQAKQLPRIITY